MNTSFLPDLALRSLLLAGLCLGLLLLARKRASGWRHSICAAAMLALTLLPAAMLLPRWEVEGPAWISRASNVAESKDWSYAGLALWVMGTLFFLSRIAWGAWRLRRWTMAAEEANSHRLNDLVNQTAAIIGLSALPKVLLGGPKTMPIAFGLLRGVILLPEDAPGWPEDRLRLVLLHELGHLKRRDSWLQLCGLLACALHWFNPFAWMLFRSLRRERELACDVLVVQSGVPPLGYARHLLDFLTASTAAGYLAAAFGGSDLKQRIQCLLKGGIPPRRKTSGWLLAGLLIFSMAAVILAAIVHPSPPVPWTPEEVNLRFSANPFPDEPTFSPPPPPQQ